MRGRLSYAVLLLSVIGISGFASDARAYGIEGLFGGRAEPDSSIVMPNPVELRNDRPERTESVLEHPRTDYDPVPMEIGSFELFPSMEVGADYDGNIYASKSGVQDDYISRARPAATIFSNWNRHAVSLSTYGDFGIYGTHSAENYSSFIADFNGRYDILHKTWVAGRAGYQYLTESRSSPDAVNGSEPATFTVTKAGATAYRGVGILKANVDYDVKRFEYEPTPSSTGLIDQSDRDRNEHYIAGKLAYDYTDNLKPYVKVGYNIRNYDNNKPHDSTGYDAVLGATADFGGITSLDVFAGMMEQYHNDFGAKEDILSPKIGARLDWNVTGLTSVVLEANRTIEETTVDGFNSYFVTGGSATVTHELRRNILAELDTSYSRSDFNGIGSRQDDTIGAGTGLRYLFTRNLYSDVAYSWAHRFSDDSTTDYVRHMISLRLGVRI